MHLEHEPPEPEYVCLPLDGLAASVAAEDS